MKEKIKKWYQMGLWNRKMVAAAVEKTVLTADEYEEIVGEAYGGEC